MEISQQHIDKLNTKIRIQLTQEDYAGKVEDSVRNYGRKMQLKGFRPGKIPSSVVKKMFGDQILVEEVNKILSRALSDFLQDNKIQYLGQPLPERGEEQSFDVFHPSEYVFEYALGLSPQVDLEYLEKNPKFPRYVIQIQDKELEQEIDNLRRRHGDSTEPEEVQEKDVLGIRLREVDAKGADVPDGIDNETSLPVDMITDKKLKKQVLKMVKGDSEVVKPFAMVDKEKDYVARFMLDRELDSLAEASDQFRMTVTKITRVAPANVDQAFFDKVFGEGQVVSEEDFRGKVQGELSRYYTQQSERKLINDLVEALLEKTDIPLPEDFLKKWIRESSEQPVAAEQVEKDYPDFAKNLKWSLIVNKIAEKHGIEVSLEEVRDRTRTNVSAQLFSYGYRDLPPEQLDNYVESLMEDKDQVRKTRDNLLEDKIFDFVKSSVQLKDKEVSVEKFNKLADKT